MAMSKDEFLNQLTTIGTCENEADRRELLSQLSDEASELFGTNEQLTNSNQSLTSDNEKLREANMKLFLRVGEQKDPAEVKKDATGIDPKQSEKRSFENLFDEKGGIK